MRGHRVWAEIDLGAIEHNLRTIRRHLSPASDIMAVVKADAYGHGAPQVAWTALEAGARALGVGDSTEALELRESGVSGPILILGAILEEEIPRVVQHDIAVTVHSTDLLKHLNAAARRGYRRLRVHLKVDTGMSRLGTSPSRALAVATEILEQPYLEFAGISTHIATRNREQTRLQLDLFRGVLRDLRHNNIRPPLVHAANSVTLFHFPDSHFHMVRPGIGLYGMGPDELVSFGLRPALSLRTQIAFLRSVPTATGVGYEHRFITRRPTRIAVCPVGYNDGYPFLLSNRASAILRGQRVRQIGNVTMDYVMFDVTDVPETVVGDEVTLIGRDGAEEIRVEELARPLGLIPYAIPCGLGRRVKKIYVRAPKGETVTPQDAIRSGPPASTTASR